MDDLGGIDFDLSYMDFNYPSTCTNYILFQTLIYTVYPLYSLSLPYERFSYRVVHTPASASSQTPTSYQTTLLPEVSVTSVAVVFLGFCPLAKAGTGGGGSPGRTDSCHFVPCIVPCGSGIVFSVTDCLGVRIPSNHLVTAGGLELLFSLAGVGGA